MLSFSRMVVAVAAFSIQLAGLVVLEATGQPPSHLASAPAWGAAQTSAPHAEAIHLGTGPHLFIDSFLIASTSNVTRTVQQPERERAAPVIRSALGRQTGQPFMTVSRISSTKYRIWYNAWRTPEEEADDFWGPALSVMESNDGIRWRAPLQRLSLPLTVSAGVVDSGPNHLPKSERYKLVYSLAEKPSTPDKDWLKTRVAFSADGINWVWYSQIDTLFPGRGSSSSENWGDILNSYYDPIRGQYGLFFRAYGPYTWTNAEGVTQTETIRRTGFMTSTDYKNWNEPQVIFSPDEDDAGITQWYGGPAGVHQRGDLLIGMLKVLRDDLTASGAPQGAFGMGYTVLAWTRDGVHWERDRTAFLEPDPVAGAWDHAHAWIDSVAPVGDELYLYYGGYKWGHKYEPQEDRQIGQVRIRRDRYVAQATGALSGTLRTPLVSLDAGYMSVNLDASEGWLDVRVFDDNDTLVSTCDRVEQVDDLDVPVSCSQPLAALVGQPLQLEFTFRNADLYAFSLSASPPPTATPTPTPSATSTPTPTLTPSPTPSPSPSPTSTPSPEMEPSPTVTPTPAAPGLWPMYLPLINRSEH